MDRSSKFSGTIGAKENQRRTRRTTTGRRHAGTERIRFSIRSVASARNDKSSCSSSRALARTSIFNVSRTPFTNLEDRPPRRTLRHDNPTESRPIKRRVDEWHRDFVTVAKAARGYRPFPSPFTFQKISRCSLSLSRRESRTSEREQRCWSRRGIE